MADPVAFLDLEPVPDAGMWLVESLAPSSEPIDEHAPPTRDAAGVLRAIQALARIRDLDTLLEQVLLWARQLVRADAGTIYMRARDQLYFSYVQNDTLFAGHTPDSRYVYSSSLPIDRASLAGYVALTGETLVIDDVYDIRSGVSYAFNPEFDSKSNYRTTSMLIVPLLTRDEVLVGVLQLINATDESGKTVPFSNVDREYALQFAQAAADAVERARLNREMVLRMVELATLRDPYETSQHAKRVGSYSVELYETWALRHRIPMAQIRTNRELLRTAAMLHDIGKVAISDQILRKQMALTPEECRRMRLHTIYGARLFRRDDSPWDVMVRDVALGHHEHWDGTGYPGHVDDIFARRVRIGRPKRREEIPIAARIVHVADVYDALISKRAYKPEWPEAEVVQYLRAEAGKRFDPEVVTLFLEMPDVIESIKRKYSY